MNLQLTDVTLRDGLQMESKILTTDQKLKLWEHLIDTGSDRIEVTSFVNPKWIPQFADQKAFCDKALTKQLFDKKTTMAFVPNEKGFETFLQYPIPWCNAFIATSQTFNKKNINLDIEQTFAILKSLTQLARENQRKIRIYISTVFGCPYEGAVPKEQVESVIKKVADFFPDEIALSDTIGVATASQVADVLNLSKRLFPIDKTALHFHNTYGLALANVETAYQQGYRIFDGSLGGIGGCPYAKGASGNLPLDELMYAGFRQGRRTEFNKAAIEKTLQFLNGNLKLTLNSKLSDILDKGGKWYGV